ncbi:MSMEG_1061 family FMN-dependent PPOX-type flavoprotein [Castellaniella sp. S9]|uniref:MSMEG_1061 family FMN-dependent PPOX-type flavoprotein n=1 Tax=Castellaniella sp. S9 TaxID=2993652 RepID=UPI0022B54792|nr:MSMEG_1061 family FMN-dependent PPOX-type flavoprotein [Castellaniella sp. S9]
MTAETKSPFIKNIHTLEQLREWIPAPSDLVLNKVIPDIDDHVRAFIGFSPYVMISTADRNGNCDASPRGGEPGFVKVLDDHHLAWSESTGNRRADSLQNLLQNDSIGMLFLLPGYDEVLRINGTAVITTESALLEQLAPRNQPPGVGVAVGVTVHECYIHCAKAALRSSLWNPLGWPDLSAMPSAAQILRDHTGAGEGDGSVEYMQRMLDESYTKRL